ncbi:hypothetical protein BDW68DRAFT_168081 [Aspergillus falconensis]
MVHSINTHVATDMETLCSSPIFGSCHNHVYLSSDARVLRVEVMTVFPDTAAACYTFTYKGFADRTGMNMHSGRPVLSTQRFAELSGPSQSNFPMRMVLANAPFLRAFDNVLTWSYGRHFSHWPRSHYPVMHRFCGEGSNDRRDSRSSEIRAAIMCVLSIYL